MFGFQKSDIGEAFLFKKPYPDYKKQLRNKFKARATKYSNIMYFKYSNVYKFWITNDKFSMEASFNNS